MAPGLPMAGGLQEASLQAELHPLCLIQHVGGGMAGDRGCIQQGKLARVALGAELQPQGAPLPCCAAGQQPSSHPIFHPRGGAWQAAGTRPGAWGYTRCTTARQSRPDGWEPCAAL